MAAVIAVAPGRRGVADRASLCGVAGEVDDHVLAVAEAGSLVS
jgi:hypothetical protein